MSLYHESLCNIFRASTGEHFKRTGWSNGRLRFRSLATDKEMFIADQETADKMFTKVHVESEDAPIA